MTGFLKYLKLKDNLVARISLKLGTSGNEREAIKIIKTVIHPYKRKQAKMWALRSWFTRNLCGDIDDECKLYVMQHYTDMGGRFQNRESLFNILEDQPNVAAWMCDHMENTRQMDFSIYACKDQQIALARAYVCKNSRVKWSSKNSRENIQGFVVDKTKSTLEIFAKKMDSTFNPLSFKYKVIWHVSPRNYARPLQTDAARRDRLGWTNEDTEFWRTGGFKRRST